MKKYLLLVYWLFAMATMQAQCLVTTDSGWFFNFGLKSNGTLWDWGSGVWGQLGDGTEADHRVPTQLGAATNWHSISCGQYNMFAIKTNGTLWCSGDNGSGQLGLGSALEYFNTLTQIGTSTNWQQVSSGGSFTLALKTDGTLWSWGQNDSFQLGDGSCCSNRLSPAQVGTATDWALVAATGFDTGLALKTNGTLWGWGLNATGLIGPSNVSARQYPIQITTATDWATITTGEGHVLALKTNGTLWSWGGGGYGETGDTLPLTYFRDTPVQIGTDTWLKVAGGYGISFGIKSNGTLWAWGNNDVGQLGDGTITNRPQPVQIGTDTDWVAVSGGYQHAVALKANGALWAWGKNDYGQLGNGTTTATIVPTAIPVAGCTLDTPSFEQEGLTLSPSPAKEEISLRYNGTAVVNSLLIYDITGRVVYESHPAAGSSLQATLPVQNLSSGMYILVLQNNGKTVASKKFIKE